MELSTDHNAVLSLAIVRQRGQAFVSSFFFFFFSPAANTAPLPDCRMTFT